MEPNHGHVSARGRVLGGVFLALFAMLSYFAVSAAGGVGGAGIYVVTFVQMLLLAAIVAPYAFAIVFLDEGEAH